MCHAFSWYQPKQGFTSTFSWCSSGQALGMQVWPNSGKQVLHKDCISKRLEDSQFLWEAEKNCCLILLFVASNRCKRFDIHVNCLLRVGGDFKFILVHTKSTFSHAVCVNVRNLSRCPVLLLFFLLQHSRVALQKAVVITGVASFFSLTISCSLMQQLEWCISYSLPSQHKVWWLHAQPLGSWAEATCLV